LYSILAASHAIQRVVGLEGPQLDEEGRGGEKRGVSFPAGRSVKCYARGQHNSPSALSIQEGTTPRRKLFGGGRYSSLTTWEKIPQSFT
jgi:hypothetical protein